MFYTLRVIYNLLYKDLIVTFRTPWELIAMMVFSMLAAIPSAISETSLQVSLVLILLFITVFTATQGFLKDKWRGVVEVYWLYPVSPIASFTSKLIYSSMLIIIAINAYVLTLALLGVGYESIINIMVLAYPLTLYLASISSLASMLTVHLKSETPLLIALTSTLAIPPLLSMNPKISLITGIAYAVISMIIAELIEYS